MFFSFRGNLNSTLKGSSCVAKSMYSRLGEVLSLFYQKEERMSQILIFSLPILFNELRVTKGGPLPSALFLRVIQELQT